MKDSSAVPRAFAYKNYDMISEFIEIGIELSARLQI